MILQDVKKNKFKTGLIVTLFTIFIGIFIYFLGLLIFEDVYMAVIIGIIFSSISAIISYYNSDKIVLKLNKARPATREEFLGLNVSLEALCIAADLPLPKLYVMETEALNAFATGRNPENSVICVTTGLLKNLNKYELEGVLAHELSHIKNYDILLQTIAIIMVGFVNIIAQIFLRGGFSSRSDDDDNSGSGILMIIGLIFIVLSPLFANLLKLAISRNREYLADSNAVLITRNKEGLINALKKLDSDTSKMKVNDVTASLFIVNPLKEKKQKDSLFSTHPNILNRIERLENIK